MENKRIFENRLNRFAISNEMKEKYLGIYDRMVAAENISEEEIQYRLRNIGFAGYVTRSGRLLCRHKEIERYKAQFCLLKVDTDKNLLRGMDVLATWPADSLQLKGKYRVYVRGDIFNPELCLRDILAQIPANRLKGVTAISLVLDDTFSEYGYNLLADAYEYKIKLFE